MHDFNLDPQVKLISSKILLDFWGTDIIANNNIHISIIYCKKIKY